MRSGLRPDISHRGSKSFYASPLTPHSSPVSTREQDRQYQHRCSNDSDDQPFAVGGDLGRGGFLDPADDREAFDHGTHMRGAFQLFAKFQPGLMGTLVVAADPERAGCHIVNGAVHGDVSRPTVTTIEFGKFVTSHRCASCAG